MIRLRRGTVPRGDLDPEKLQAAIAQDAGGLPLRWAIVAVRGERVEYEAAIGL